MKVDWAPHNGRFARLQHAGAAVVMLAALRVSEWLMP